MTARADRWLAAMLAPFLLPATAVQARPCRGELVYFASMASGPGAGIVGARLDTRSGMLCGASVVAAIDKATWLAVFPGKPLLYATRESSDAASPSIFAYRVDRGSGALHAIDGVAAGGTGAAHISIDPRSRTLFVANWGSGHLSVLPIQPTGAAAPPASVDRLEGTGPARLQGIPRVHAALLDPGGRFVLATNFSGDRIEIFGFDARRHLLLPRVGGAVLPAGSEPRHLAFHPNGRFLYVINQQASTIDTFGWNAKQGVLQRIGTVSTLGPGYAGQNDAAALILSHDGRSLYASDRGEDSIVVYTIDAAGLPIERQHVAAGGSTPRALALDPSERWMLVTNQGSDQVAVFARDRATGLLAATPVRLSMRAPAGAVFVTR